MYWKVRWGRLIHQVDAIQVYQNIAYRWLTLSSPALQTLINRRTPSHIELTYLRALTYAARKNPGACCVLGLGGGGVAHALAPVFNTIPLTAVECSQPIIEIASEFFMVDKLHNLTIVHQDAHVFVTEHLSCYQHLLVDLFNDKNFPSHCNSPLFFAQCKQRLLPEGILAVNLASLTQQLPILRLIRECFLNQTLLLPVRNTTNLIVFAAHNIQPLLSICYQDKQIKTLNWHPEWGNVAGL
jgi:spermidine synthase